MQRPTFAQLDSVLRAAATQLDNKTAKLVPLTAGDAEAEAGAGMDAWRVVAAELSAAVLPSQAPRDVYASGLISELIEEGQPQAQGDADFRRSSVGRTNSIAPPTEDADGEEEPESI